MRRLDSGTPELLGLTLAPGGANVAVYSAHAAKIELCLFDRAGEAEIERIALPERTGDVFHGFVAGIATGDRYGVRAHGPYDPRNGHRFNPAKLLVDPYVKAIDRRFALDPSMFGELPDGVTRNDMDSAPFVPKGIAVAPIDAHATHRHVPWRDTIIYELHVRGFTRLRGDVPQSLRGTCAGLAHPASIDCLTQLGVTTVELMPIAAIVDERHLVRLGLTNYWGYNPVAFFVPDPRLAPNGMDELRQCIDTLHAAGIEVLLDIVLNHTGEGDALGPTLSFRGLDNATYYRTVPGEPWRYVDDTGCGNTLALDRAPLVRLAVDVLKHYAAAGFDGFRFDLATIMLSGEGAFAETPPLLEAMEREPALQGLKFVAEPWDVGPGGYRLGAFPSAWSEWNDRYRDTCRRFWRGDAGQVGDFATRIAGSSDIFAGRSRSPASSINFVAAHDGFTLADLVSYESKHNEANGENNRDGTNANFSWNHGLEGFTDQPAIRAARQQAMRSLLGTLFVSRGIPQLTMGDEAGRTQRGNNNAYAQDNAVAWLDWENRDGALVAFVQHLIALRKAHPALHSNEWLTGRPLDASGIPDVEWRLADGRSMDGNAWHAADNRQLVAVVYTAADQLSSADRVAIAFNADHREMLVKLPQPREGFDWCQVIDTALPAGYPLPARDVEGGSVFVAARSMSLTVERPAISRRWHPSPVTPENLARLARAAGIAPEWWEVSGRHHVVSPDTTHALLDAMRLAARTNHDALDSLHRLAEARERRALPPVVIAPIGTAATIALMDSSATRRRRALHLTLEDGSALLLPFDLAHVPSRTVVAADGAPVTQRVLSLPMLPMGRHRLAFEDGEGQACDVVVTPHRCYTPERFAAGARCFGLAAHLYALRRPDDQGIGDFTTLRDIGIETAAAAGATVGINPLHALFSEDRDRASPYHPSDRRFLDPIYIDIEKVPDFAGSHDARRLFAGAATEIAAARANPMVDYPNVWRLKRALLAACFAAFEQRSPGDPLVADFERFVATGGAAMREFALYETIAALHPRTPWWNWPIGLRRPDGSEVEALALRHRTQLRFTQYQQWLADRQLGEAADEARQQGLSLGFYRDLAVGAAPDGAEAWANAAAGLLAQGASIGAPPDPFSAAGQIWNLPPPIPVALTTSGYARFADLIAANMLHAGALRIDHVMGLARLFWVPQGASAIDGGYVHYPMQDLLAMMALQSVRASCVVVGEDLGTVPAGFREHLAAADVLSYRVVWFEREGSEFRSPSSYPVKAAACVSTHDLPTVAGWWQGTDVDELRSLGLIADDEASQARSERTVAKHALIDAMRAAGVVEDGVLNADTPASPDVTAAIHRYAAAAASSLVLLQADDLAEATTALNLPGTDRERPNWRRKLPLDTGALWKTPVGQRARADIAPSRS